uniref:Uncharacterized protein n=1 Tax=Anopheles maculatus TaxID=74869 RepID=A0A182SBV6_9DIPT
MYGTDFVATLPPSNYPPTAPYAELTSYFRRLFRAGELSRYVVQALLYPQVTRTYARGEVVMRRRRHKTTVRMQRREKEAAAQEAPERCDVEAKSAHQSQNRKEETTVRNDASTARNRPTERSYSSSDSESSSCASSSCSRSRSNFERQNAVDYVEEDDDAYETITFFAGKSKTNADSSCEGSTVYESYDDPHSTEGGSFEYKNDTRKTSSTSSKTGAVEGNFSEDGGCDNARTRSSEMIGSAAVPFLRLNDRESLHSNGDAHATSVQSNAGRSSGIHTSTARLLLGELKQQCSEQSQMSSFEHRAAHGRMACENLLNLDESMKIKHSLQQKTITEERHSMPTYFVGNRFNNSSVTEIYIPSWKEDCQAGDGQGPTTTTTTPPNANTANGASSTDRNSVHSSSLDIPAIVPVPDPVTAELLYNFPPTEVLDMPNRMLGCLSREQSPFRKHSINSDKKLVLNPNHHRKDKDDSQSVGAKGSEARVAHTGVPEAPPTATARRCLSYQYVELSGKGNAPLSAKKPDANNNNVPGDVGKAKYDNSVTNRREDDSNHPMAGSGPDRTEHKCRFCSFYSRGHSPHSSDSGMAGSCTISSPDGPAKFSGDFLLCDYAEQRTLGEDAEVDGLLRERETRGVDVVDGMVRACSQSSFALRQSRSSHSLGRFALVRESEFDYTDSGQYDHPNDQHPHANSQSHSRRQGSTKLKSTVASGTGAAVELEPAENVERHSPHYEHAGPDRTVRSRSEDRVLSSFSSPDRDASEPRHYSGRSRIVVNLFDRSSAAAMQRVLTQSSVPPYGDTAADRITYKTGLYAHWWKKEKLPIFVVTSNESLKLPPASGSLSPRHAPCGGGGGESSKDRGTISSKATTSRQGDIPSGGDDGLLPRPNISANDGGAARGSGKTLLYIKFSHRTLPEPCERPHSHQYKHILIGRAAD